MRQRSRALIISALVALFSATPLTSQEADSVRTLDDFERDLRWHAPEVPRSTLRLSVQSNEAGELDDSHYLRLDYDFSRGGQFVSAKLDFDEPITLPARYLFRYRLRSAGPDQQIDFKLFDESGRRVHWARDPDASFTEAWTTRSVRDRHIRFAWGPGGRELELTTISAIEIAVTMREPVSGTIDLDHLELVTLPPPPDPLPPITLQTDSTIDGRYAEAEPIGNDGTVELITTADPRATMTFDFGYVRDIGGLILHWDQERYPLNYRVELAQRPEAWTAVHAVIEATGGTTYLHLPDQDARYLRLRIQFHNEGRSSRLRAIEIVPARDASTLNGFLAQVGERVPQGTMPPMFHGRQTFWTVLGLPGDEDEALLSEYGVIETNRGGFTLEPFVMLGDELVGWGQCEHQQSLANGSLPIPTVVRAHDDFELEISPVISGEPGAASVLVRYRVTNRAQRRITLALTIAIRPFQVLPPWQDLNLVGGVSRIEHIELSDRAAVIDGRRTVVSLTTPERAGATAFDQGEIAFRLSAGRFPPANAIRDPMKLASAGFGYDLTIDPGESTDVLIAFPLRDRQPIQPEVLSSSGEVAYRRARARSVDAWSALLDQPHVVAPPAFAAAIATAKTQLGYLLIHADPPKLRPGSRTYERSWIRDGSLSAIALASFGHSETAISFADWYASFIHESGEVPAVVDHRGPDPILEHDSTGQYLHMLWRLYELTGDRGLLERHADRVERAVEYLRVLRSQRQGDRFKGTPFEGILPQSASHEGYLDNPMHSYWDGFFALRGIRDAAEIARTLGMGEHTERWSQLADDFQRDLFRSIERAATAHGIDFVPGCAELGDRDACSTAIAYALALTPPGSVRPLFDASFDAYWIHFLARARGTIEWRDYTPYEVRVIEAFIRRGEPGRARALLDWFLAEQTPAGWNQWAEVRYRDSRYPGYIGDMPHTWVGADFVRSVRSMLAYERESDDALVITAGVDPGWLDHGDLTVNGLLTTFGTLNYRMTRLEGSKSIRINVDMDSPPPPGGVIVPVPEGFRLAESPDNRSVHATDAGPRGASQIRISRLPAQVTLTEERR